MIAVPFIYFALLTCWLWRKRGIDPSTYISFLLTLTCFFSIWIYHDPVQQIQFSRELSEVTIVPAVLFCILHTLFIVPVYKYDFRKIQHIRFQDYTFIKVVVIIYFFLFLVYIIFYHKEMIFYLTAGDEIRQLRAEQSAGDLSLPPLPYGLDRAIIPFRLMSGMSYIIIFLYIFLITFTRLSWKMHVMMICGSLMAVLTGILGIDRSKTFYWVLIAGLALVMFWRFMDIQTKKYISRVGIVVVALLTLYFMSVSLSRFGEDNKGVGLDNALVSYAGQSYINFCYFFNVYESPEGVTTKHLFPAYHHWVAKDYDGGVPYQRDMTLKTGIFCGVFYTQLGTFIISAGQVGPFMITLVYLLLCMALMRRRGSTVTFAGLMATFLLLIIPSTGIISYFYTGYSDTYTIVVFFILIIMLKQKKSKEFSVGEKLKIE